MSAQDEQRYGYVRISGWHGTTWTRVLVVGTTPKRYRIRAIDRTILPRRILVPGETALVPHDAVRLDSPDGEAA